MYRSIDTDSGLNIYAVIYDGSNELANGSGFESYNAAHWASLYAIAASEQGSSGHYSISDPSYLVGGSYYTATFFERLGGSPAVGDRFIGAHNFTVQSSATITIPSALITKLRILANDTTTSNLITQESLTGSSDGSNKNFRTQYQNLVSGSVYLTTGSSFRIQTGFTVDTSNGLVAFTAAPSNGASLVVDYNFQWFTDTDYSDFLSDAALLLGSSNDPSTVNAGLIMALQQYALYYYYMRRSTQYAHKYQSSGGQASQNVDGVTDKFRKLAETAMKMGDKFRDDFYTKQGLQKTPASAVISYQFNPMTPRR